MARAKTWTARVVARTSLPPLAKETNMKAIAAALLGLMMLATAGCNTVEGAGKDVKATGQAVERAADKSKPY
jgi:predicted small secreted protein